jgi:hypothetical protein
VNSKRRSRTRVSAFYRYYGGIYVGLWRVRAGKKGEYVDIALEHNIASIEYEEVPDLLTFPTRETLRTHVDQLYSRVAPKKRDKDPRQLWAFSREIAQDDIVAMPQTSRGVIYFGIVDGPYEYRNDLPSAVAHTRRVHWLKSVPRTDIDADILRLIDTPQTVRKIEGKEAESRLRSLLLPSSVPYELAGTNIERGGTEQPIRRAIAEAPPRSVFDAASYADPEVRRQALDRRNKAHHALVVALLQKARTAQLECECTQYADALADGCIFEMKSLEQDDTAQIRAALGQLYHYLFLHRGEAGYEDADLCVVFDRPIDAELCSFLNTKAHLGVVWRVGDRFDGTADMRKRYSWIFRDSRRDQASSLPRELAPAKGPPGGQCVRRGA